MSSFANKAVIVTGAGSGIGRATAILFGEAGANVAVADINAESASRCAEQIQAANGSAIPMACDAGCEAQVRRMVNSTLERFGRIDCLVCSAGVMLMRSAELASPQDWEKCFSLVSGAALAARYACGQMKQQGGGAVVFVSSICGHRPDRGFATYSASKAALLMLTRSLALDYGSSNIRVNAVSPGPVATPGLKAIVTGAGANWDDWTSSVAGMQCIRTMTQAEDVGRAILFLCSNDARMITGTSLAVDGGLMARSSC